MALTPHRHQPDPAPPPLLPEPAVPALTPSATPAPTPSPSPLFSPSSPPPSPNSSSSATPPPSTLSSLAPINLAAPAPSPPAKPKNSSALSHFASSWPQKISPLPALLSHPSPPRTSRQFLHRHRTPPLHTLAPRRPRWPPRPRPSSPRRLGHPLPPPPPPLSPLTTTTQIPSRTPEPRAHTPSSKIIPKLPSLSCSWIDTGGLCVEQILRALLNPNPYPKPLAFSTYSIFPCLSSPSPTPKTPDLHAISSNPGRVNTNPHANTPT